MMVIKPAAVLIMLIHLVISFKNRNNFDDLAIDVCRIVKTERAKDDSINSIGILIFQHKFDEAIVDEMQACIQLPTTINDLRDVRNCTLQTIIKFFNQQLFLIR
jgi:hypothetical protein